MICDLGCMWKETVVVQSDTFSLCFSRATENPQKSSVMVIGFPTDIRTKHFLFIGVDNGKGKGKAIPLQAWTGPKGCRRLRLPYFKTIDT